MISSKFQPYYTHYSNYSFLKEVITTVLAAVLGPVGGVLLFIPIYHPLHDVFKIHSEVTFFIILTVSLVLVWSGDRSPKLFKSTPVKNHWTTFLLVAHLVLHYTTFWLMPILFNPEDEVSTGIKEKIGPCNQYVPLQTVSGKVNCIFSVCFFLKETILGATKTTVLVCHRLWRKILWLALFNQTAPKWSPVVHILWHPFWKQGRIHYRHISD